MTLIRGMRFLSDGYARDFSIVPDTDENISTGVFLETNDGCDAACQVKLEGLWPDSIVLDASMHPQQIGGKTVVERVEDNVSLGKNNIYVNPMIDSCSPIKNANLFCAKVIINFENAGEYAIDGKNNLFANASFDEYSLEFAGGDKILLEKEFPTTKSGAIVEKYVHGAGKILQTEGIPGRAQYRFYAYGGFYEYGAHPQSIESCVFHTTSEGRASRIYLSKLSGLRKLRLEPSNAKNVLNDSPALFMDSFTPSQKATLYEEIKSGACRLNVINNNSRESCVYASNGLHHITNTNLIKINFTITDTQSVEKEEK